MTERRGRVRKGAWLTIAGLVMVLAICSGAGTIAVLSDKLVLIELGDKKIAVMRLDERTPYAALEARARESIDIPVIAVPSTCEAFSSTRLFSLVGIRIERWDCQ